MGNDDAAKGADHHIDNRPNHHSEHRTDHDADKRYSNVLRVKADPPDTTNDDRRKNVKALAGAIAHGLRRFGEVHVRAIGKEATYKAVKAIIEASAFVAVHHHDLYTRPGYIMADDVTGKDEMTGISFLVVSSQSRRASED